MEMRTVFSGEVEQPNVNYRVTGRVASITMSRPGKMNALSKGMFGELQDALMTAESDGKVAFVTIQGAGRAFSAGLDIIQVAGFKTKVEAREFVYKLVKPFWDTFLGCDKTIVSLVNGPAYGAGAEIALFSDIVLASTDASFAFSGGRVGALCCISPLMGPLMMNGRKVGEMNFTGQALTAEEAYKLGMINTLVSPGQLDTAMSNLERELLRVSPVSNSSFKRIRNSVIPSRSYPTAFHELYRTLTSRHFKAGAEAFAKKTPPNFYG